MYFLSAKSIIDKPRTQKSYRKSTEQATKQTISSSDTNQYASDPEPGR